MFAFYLGLGVWAGNFLYYMIMHNAVIRGMVQGLLAGILTFLLCLLL